MKLRCQATLDIRHHQLTDYFDFLSIGTDLFSIDKMPIEEVRQKLQKELIGRQKQIELLVSLFGEKHEMTLPSLFIYGHTGGGKSLVISRILEELEGNVVTINCIECYSQKVLYEQVLEKVTILTVPAEAHQGYIKCDNMNDFVKHLTASVKEQKIQDETLYIILDKAEKLRDMEPHILPAFLRLQEFTQLNICVIFLSEIIWEKFRSNTGICEPYTVFFPDYTKDDIFEILCIDCPAEYSREFYASYINLLLSVFFYVCRDLKEIRHLASLNFAKFEEPIKKGEATVNDTRKLWKNIEPHLKRALQTVYLREVSSSQWEKIQQENIAGQEVSVPSLHYRSYLELPFYSKYLLIAAYLASYNPAKTDRRFFSKRSEKMKGKFKRNNERKSNHLLGPKLFTMDRLLAIFYSIVEGRVAPSADLFMQISSLVTLHLLSQVSSDDPLELPKYKCLVSLETIRSISRTVNFDILRYLYDFL